MKRVWLLVLASTTLVLPAARVAAQSRSGTEARQSALQRLQAATGGAVVITEQEATGGASSIRMRPGTGRGLGTGPAATREAKQQQSAAFFRDYGALVGITDPTGLRLTSTQTDKLGETHLTWTQFHRDVPVFAATIKTHFDASNQLKAVNGTAIPDIDVNTTPSWTRERAAQVARAAVVAERGSAAVGVGTTTLYVYREGLAQGVPGPNQLAWEVEVTDGAGIRDLVYVGAHSGKVIDTVSAIRDQLERRAFDGHDLPKVPSNYPQGAYWLEGQSFPTLSQEANNMIVSSKETYDLFQQTFGLDSFDNKGTPMDAIFNRGYDCPNASWNGTFISFCPGFTADDVTSHEWAHAYTEYTHGLIYQWQPGALNESYSDIWGEVIDRINGRGNDSPGSTRSAGACSTSSPPVATLQVNAPTAIAGAYFAQAALFGPQLSAPITREVVAALDAADAAGPTTLDGCTALTNAAAVNGKIALINRGGCEFSRKVLNAQNAGAAAVIIANNAATGLPGMGPGVDAALVTIPSIGVQQSTGDAIRAQLAAAATVNATVLASPGTDATVSWLLGEDAAGGALRDMWNPACYSNPGKVTDTAYYMCSATDGGGVHTNSGVPNHGFALLVDGGAYNGQSLTGLGLTKAAHIYFRAQSVYQVQASGFADHADALEASCSDLANGDPLTPLPGEPAGQVISEADCTQVTKMIAAVELRTPPTFCNFPSLMDTRTAPTCSASTTSGVTTAIASYNFESDPSATWTTSHVSGSPAFTARDWTWVNALPSGKAGSGFFAPDPNGGVCGAAGENGVLQLTSPDIVVPLGTDFARMTFEHWFAAEPGWDGGNLQISVNGGSWQLVPPSEFSFNNYTAFLFSAEQGNSNPLAGQPAWTGANPGTINGGSWARTHVNLGNAAKPGDTIRLRWNFGTDGCGGRVGWYLDNVNLFSCTPNVPTISVADVPVVEGNAGESQMAFTVRLSKATINPVTVTYEIVDGSAKHGNDFDAVSGTVVIPASTATSLFTSAPIFVTIKGDVVPEGAETFRLRITGVVNATIADGEAIATIEEDDVRPGGSGQ